MPRFLVVSLAVFGLAGGLAALETATPNDVRDERSEAYALTGGTVVVDATTRLEAATLLVAKGLVVDVVAGRQVPAGYVEWPVEGRLLYPALVDLESGYGLPEPATPARGGFGRQEVLDSTTQGPFGVNEAIRSEFRAVEHFAIDGESAAKLRELGFGAVLSHRADGLAQGSGVLVSLAESTENEVVLRAEASAHFSFSKGSAKQSYPRSPMGYVAVLRQTQLDADWYGALAERPYVDESLEAWIEQQDLPQIFAVESWSALLRADRLGDELGRQYIFRGSGDEYRRVDAVKASGGSLILPLAFPEAEDVSDVFEARQVSLADLKHWELAPANPARLAAAGIDFALTSSGSESFWEDLRKAIAAGLDERTALASLTTSPAAMIGMAGRLGVLRKGAIANFLVTSGELFDEGTKIQENWIQGRRFAIAEVPGDHRGEYRLEVEDLGTFELSVAGSPESPEATLPSLPSSADVVPPEAGAEDQAEGKDEAQEGGQVEIAFEDGRVRLQFVAEEGAAPIRLAGWVGETGWAGRGQLAEGRWIAWSATKLESVAEPVEETEVATARPAKTEEGAAAPVQVEAGEVGEVIYPFEAFGAPSRPRAEDVLIRDATVWTNEAEGVVEGLDVLVADGRIAEIGRGLEANGARVIEAAGMHLTPGLIDEHSHIALAAINDTATNSGMVRMSDVVDSEDVSIYRNLAGGVTAAQLLHGSANPIGGQSAIVKLRWGALPSEMLIDGADGFIKFALGENVKRARSRQSIRYPGTRMGVEQVYRDAFTAAEDYRDAWQAWEAMSAKERSGKRPPRRDLALETMVEILEGRRFITCHSYVQSEIAMLMRVAEDFGFRVNTFTHILEGYKVAESMAEHGVGGSTFSDWWAYKWEVRYAIPYNAALMSEAGVTVAINSDDAEMSRRLNQEAAKAVKYGDLSEEDALKLVTLNPARLLHLDDRMGSIRVGKDADLVLWTDPPLSIYAIADKTLVDGIVYYDREQDLQKRQWLSEERARLIAKMGKEKKKGGPPGGGKGKSRRPPRHWQCDSLHGWEYLTGE